MVRLVLYVNQCYKKPEIQHFYTTVQHVLMIKLACKAILKASRSHTLRKYRPRQKHLQEMFLKMLPYSNCVV